ncbi:MAG: MltA domain-containing protein [Desulfovibrio sp.]|nr:MltA domain-containing protein [Desulfovibrio sp.]
MGKPKLRGGKIMHRTSPSSQASGKQKNKSFGRAVLSWALVGLLTLPLVACSAKKPEPQLEFPVGPAVSLQEGPDYFVQNLHSASQGMRSWSELAVSVNKSLRYVKTKPASGTAIRRPGLHVTWGELRNTLERLQQIIPRLDKEPGLLLANFKWVKVPNGIKYSGYYSPEVKASLTPKKGYEQAIYRLPPEIPAGKHKKFADRRTIEEKQILANRGLELAWAKDPVDVFFLEIQGSGCLLLEDGRKICVNYAGQNGHKYKSSGRIMREKGLLKRGDIFEQRQWFKDNPDRVREILNDNPSYVFFKLGGNGPTGAMGAIVDDWRTLATDRSFIPLGSIVAYGVNIPDPSKGQVPLRGIGFAQDVGGAIKRNRIDIYCGSNDRANYVASFLDAKGPAWILLAK